MLGGYYNEEFDAKSSRAQVAGKAFSMQWQNLVTHQKPKVKLKVQNPVKVHRSTFHISVYLLGYKG